MSAETPRPAANTPWGVGMTLLLGGAIFLAYSVVQGFAMIPLIILAVRDGLSPEKVRALALNGFNLSLATAVACPVLILLCAAAAWARQKLTVTEYLAIHPVAGRRVIAWSLLAAGAALGLSLLNEALGREVPEFVALTYESAGYMPWFWSAVGVCAPVAEEILFRGFLFAGLAASRLRTAGAVGVTSILFVGLHLGQYEWPDLLQLGVFGILFGIGRARTGSIVTSVAMHVVVNLTALTLFSASESRF